VRRGQAGKKRKEQGEKRPRRKREQKIGKEIKGVHFKLIHGGRTGDGSKFVLICRALRHMQKQN